MTEALYAKLMDYALRALGRRMMTEFEIHKKLVVKLRKITDNADDNVGEDVVKRVMNRLVELELVNDDQYVRDFIRTKLILNPSGKRGLQSKLRLKGIDYDFFEKIWDELQTDEQDVLERACNSFVRKKGSIDSRKQKERLMRYLASRGFEPHAIYKQLSKYS